MLCNNQGCDGCYKDIALAYIIKYGVINEKEYQYLLVDGITQVERKINGMPHLFKIKIAIILYLNYH